MNKTAAILRNKFFLFPIFIFLLLLPISYFYICASNKALQIVWVNYLVFLFSGIVFGVVATLLRMYGIKNVTSRKTTILFWKTLVICYGIFLLLMTMSRYNRYLSEAIDVFYYHAAVWQLSEFKLPMFDNGAAPVWADHFEPILFFIVPFYWFIKNAQVLFFIQALVAVSGIIPLYLSAKKILSSQILALALSSSYLLFGGMQFGYAYGFHPIVFFPTVFFWTYYFYVSKKIKPYFIFVILCLFVKEEASFLMSFWGLYLFFIRKDRRTGIITGALGVFWYILCFHVIFPYFNKGGGFRHLGQYTNALSSPIAFLKELVTPSYKIDTVLHTFGSFGFVLFIFPPAFLIVIPALLEKLLSDNLAGANGAHYSAAITGLVVVATIESIYFFTKRLHANKQQMVKVFLAGFIVYVAYFANLLYGYVGYSPFFLENKTAIPDGNITYLQEVLDSIPKNATVTALYQIVPRIDKHYTKIRVFPQKSENSDYVVVDLLIPPVLLTPQILNDGLDRMNKDKRYKMEIHYGGVVMYKKIRN